MADPTLTLTTYDWPARHIHSGNSDVFTVSAGKSLQIRYWNPGERVLLNQTCPEGKSWSVRVHVEITETNV